MLRTPFHQFHLEAGGKMVAFAGWEMPIMYSSIIEEHQQVRRSGGMFDVSHMGRIHFKGPEARIFLERICTRRIHDLQQGQCRYSLICNERGGVRDDVLVYRYGAEDFMLVVNAANRGKLLEHFKSQQGKLKFKLDDRTEKTAMLALQGPRVIELVSRFSDEIPALKNYRFCVKSLLIFKLTISRTGYTGEDGVEVILPANMAATVVKLMLKEGGAEAAELIKPTGLGARDSLRLEAGMPLYGQEMDEDHDPISAGLSFGMNLEKDEHELGEKFVGQEALKKIRAEGPRNKLVGLVLEGRRTARSGMTIKNGDAEVGRITSACLSPTLGVPIALGYVPAELAEIDQVVQLEAGSKILEGRVTKFPFYRRPLK